MFAKILIANRGEIACRVIHTARKMNIATVAIYTASDYQSKHAIMADEAFEVADYLDAKSIIAVAKKSAAEAIHPCYGFLSENPSFVRSMTKAGLVFIGPSASAIQKMGLKDKAKALMEKASVPIIAGYHGESQDVKFLQKQADNIGYPLLIKARAGGGGKGIRLVENKTRFAESLKAAQDEALASFADGVCLLERYITNPRHIEVQVFCDNYGNGVHIFERDCSLQRRHQKVIEEAPAPNLSPSVRKAMGEAAVKAALSIGYCNAGTVEFIYSPATEEFMFMEMNTRLQVEHPVSEAISGFDFVEWQLRIAAGEKLPKTQSQISKAGINGHAIEARIYAEDAKRDFMPCTGKLHYYRPPKASEFEPAPLRIDSGIKAGDSITPYYDPMIAKLIAHGKDRDDALKKLQKALRKYHIGGVTTNIGFLHALCELPAFTEADLHTGLIEKHIKSLNGNDNATTETWAIAALAMMNFKTKHSLSKKLKGFQNWGTLQHSTELQHANRRQKCTAKFHGDDYIVMVGSEKIHIGYEQFKGTDWIQHGNSIFIFDKGQSYEFSLPADTASAGKASSGILISPLPAVIKSVFVKGGSKVKKGDKLLMLEAMKMQNTLTAENDGTIKKLFVKVGDTVAEGATLLEFS